MAKTVCFGEIMLRLSPPGFERLLPVAACCRRRSAAAKPTSPSAWRSSAARATTSRGVPANPVGDAAVRALRAEGVRRRARSSAAASRLGIYFAETGASQRASTVIYDRAHSAISELDAGHRAVGTRCFAGADWFHWTGITPALGAVGRRAARAKRSRRRSRPARASASISTSAASSGPKREAQAVDAAADAAGRRRDRQRRRPAVGARHRGARTRDVTGGALDLDGYRAAAERVATEFGVAQVAVTLRESLSASDNALERGAARRGDRRRSTTASATSCAWSIASAAATASRPA